MKQLELYAQKSGKRLRLGYTTGSCAAGAAMGATLLLLCGAAPPCVRVNTPGGIPLDLELEHPVLGGDFAACAVQKDAGDDPDVTDGMFIHARAVKIPAGIEIQGGEGIGRVTLPGLSRPVGEAAINPTPLRMIREAVAAACERNHFAGGIRVEIFAPQGAEIAERTFNARLGIVGGISILGTSGIVEPMSEAALVATIRAEIDVRRAAGAKTLLIVPGNYGRDFARDHLGIDLETAVKASNFIGETLDCAVASGAENLLLLGHAGKLVKLAAGIMNTHSSVADGRMEVLCAHAGVCGLAPDKLRELLECPTVEAADALLRREGIAGEVWRSVAEKARQHLEYRLKNRAEIAFAAFLSESVRMRSPNFDKMLQKLKQGE